VPEPFVDADDIAEVAVAALTNEGHAGRAYELTGPRALTFAEVANVLSDVSGRPVRYVPVSTDDFVAAASGTGMPVDDARGLPDVFTKVLDGRNVDPQDGVVRALGRPPRSFETFARGAAATGVWNCR
jgi:uncharacterized protein YbjT (DUF2867 family)